MLLLQFLLLRAQHCLDDVVMLRTMALISKYALRGWSPRLLKTSEIAAFIALWIERCSTAKSAACSTDSGICRGGA